MPRSQERLGGRGEQIGEGHHKHKEHHLHDILGKDTKGGIEKQQEGSLTTEHHKVEIIWKEEGPNIGMRRIDIIKGCLEKNIEIDVTLKGIERNAVPLTLRGEIKDPIMRRGERLRIEVDQGKDQVLDTDMRSEDLPKK